MTEHGSNVPVLNIKVWEIRDVVARRYGITRTEMIGPRRTQRLARPRQIAMSLARSMTSASLPKIGSVFGDRDHTTVLHAVRRVRERMDRFPMLEIELNSIEVFLMEYAIRPEWRRPFIVELHAMEMDEVSTHE